MPEFDLRAGIRELAEANWPCPKLPYTGWKGTIDEWHQRFCSCDTTSGTGRIVPFAALRVGTADRDMYLFEDGGETAICLECGASASESILDVEHLPECRGWIPEPDVEKACWRIMQTLWCWTSFRDSVNAYMNNGPALQRVVIRAALAWLEEQRVTKSSSC